jgi:hypothetical protein
MTGFGRTARTRRRQASVTLSISTSAKCAFIVPRKNCNASFASAEARLQSPTSLVVAQGFPCCARRARNMVGAGGRSTRTPSPARIERAVDPRNDGPLSKLLWYRLTSDLLSQENESGALHLKLFAAL